MPMVTLKVVSVIGDEPEEISVNTGNVTWVGKTYYMASAADTPTCPIHFAGGGRNIDAVGTREEVSKAIDEANRVKAPLPLWDSPERQQMRMAAAQQNILGHRPWARDPFDGIGFGQIGRFLFDREPVYSNPCPTGPSKFKPPRRWPDRPKGWCTYCAVGNHRFCEAQMYMQDGPFMNLKNAFCRCGCKKDGGR